jgi:outer membrane protein OmpA-like peptidoglycan-associated protein
MATFKLGELQKGKTFETGQTHALTILSTQRVRLVGLFFDLNKCFLLPTALPGIKAIKKHYDKHPESDLLLVGHTDTSGREEYNETLSLERAKSVAAFLTDEAEPWLAFFKEGKPIEKRWGTLEVQQMLTVLPGGGPFFYSGEPNGVRDSKHEKAVKAFQKSVEIEDDGIAGPITQKALVEKYMALDNTSLPKGSTITTHGCGENFPVVDTPDGERNPDNRRVEIFFFDDGIDPKPAGDISKKGSTDYPKWLEQVSETFDLSDDTPESLTIQLSQIFGIADFSSLQCQVSGEGLSLTPPIDESGQIEITLPVGLEELKLQLMQGDTLLFEEVFPIEPTPAVETVRGQKIRLNHLGFGAGPINDEADIDFRIAVKRFQNRSGLPMTGEVDESTQTALEVQFGA